MKNKQQISEAKKKRVLEFFKDAFCVDGKVRLVRGKFKLLSIIELNDSKRGKFFIGRLEIQK